MDATTVPAPSPPSAKPTKRKLTFDVSVSYELTDRESAEWSDLQSREDNAETDGLMLDYFTAVVAKALYRAAMQNISPGVIQYPGTSCVIDNTAIEDM